MFRDFASGSQREHRPPHAKERASEAQKSDLATFFFFLSFLATLNLISLLGMERMEVNSHEKRHKR